MALIWKDKKSNSWFLDYTLSSVRRVRKRVSNRSRPQSSPSKKQNGR